MWYTFLSLPIWAGFVVSIIIFMFQHPILVRVFKLSVVAMVSVWLFFVRVSVIKLSEAKVDCFMLHGMWPSFNHWHTFASEMCLYFDTIKHLCFLCFMMLSYIFIAAFVWVLAIKYTFYIKSRFQCLWLGFSEAWILTHYCTLKHSSTLVCVAWRQTFGTVRWKNDIN